MDNVQDGVVGIYVHLYKCKHMQRTDILVDSIYAQGTVPVRKENAINTAGPTLSLYVLLCLLETWENIW